MSIKKKGRKRTAFVPTVVFSTSVLGVIPACATGCGGEAASVATIAFDAGLDATKDVTSEQVFLGVAAVGYCAFCDGGFTVAAIGYDSGLDAGSDADAGKSGETCPPYCTVAYMGFDSGMDSGDKG